MTMINETFTNAILADATYVGGLTPTIDLSKALEDRMTPALATYISQNFTVVTQIESGSSFDATIWRETATGKLYLSMRGTQGILDILTDISLAFTGNVRDQFTDMVNWWLRISTPVGQQATQIRDSGPAFLAAPSVPGQGLITAAELATGI